jgi:hypothetical protein
MLLSIYRLSFRVTSRLTRDKRDWLTEYVTNDIIDNPCAHSITIEHASNSWGSRRRLQEYAWCRLFSIFPLS